MKRHFIIASLLAATLSFNCAVAKNNIPLEQQTLMTIDGKPVTVSEFNYLYNKNNQQQSTPQSVKEYLDLFVNYKIKVAEAEAAGLDTTASFIQELQGYARELAKPYLEDAEVMEKLKREAYGHTTHEIEVQHLMVSPQQGRQLLDSLRNVIAAGGSFDDLARQYSVDRSSSQNGGYMGWVSAGRFPWAFEEAVYNTPVGELSQVVTTPFGYHLVKVLADRPAKGSVLVQHILKLTRGLLADQAAMKHNEIDSIHALLVAGADFDDIASRESEDPGSARQGGRLPWFTTGQMVKPFEDASFQLPNGAISDVFETSYGYHIVKKLDARDVAPYEEVEAQLAEAISRDERAELPRRSVIDRMAAKYNLEDNRLAMAMVQSVIRNHNGLDSAAYASLMQTPAPVMKYDGGVITIPDVLSSIAPLDGVSVEDATKIFENRAKALADDAMIELAIKELPSQNADYSNLLNEYRDGILLFEISDRNVWSRAKDDTEGLRNWFENHRGDYQWDKPKFKSYIIFTTGDSLMAQIDDYLATHEVEPAQLSMTMRHRFGKNVRVEKVLGAQGENAIVDYLGFGGEKPEAAGKWVAYKAYKPEIIDAPQEVSDVRSAVTADYQNYLEQEWLKAIKARHKVKPDKKVLKQLEKNAQ